MYLKYRLSSRASANQIKVSIKIEIDETADDNGGVTPPVLRRAKPGRGRSSGSITSDEIPVSAAMVASGTQTFLSEERVAKLGASLASSYRAMERTRREEEVPF